ncbi:MAG: hypothetical protein K2Q06_04625, partial [Parvularculaceae bacterium]|nr:hypothetical protein [Parvularculaceae bacterium]
MTKLVKLIISTALLGVGATGFAVAAKLTPEAINADVSLSGPSVRGVATSPDGALVTFLKGRPEESNRLDLWAYDAATGSQRMLVSSTALAPDRPLSEEEKNRRERRRIYDVGIISYDWDAQGKRVLVPL